MAKFNMFDFIQDLKAITGRDDITTADAIAVRRDIARHNTLQERFCNGFQTYSGDEDIAARKRGEGRERGVERRLAAFFGDSLAEFTGDPRGQTVKLKPWQTGNPHYDAYVAAWGEARRLTYFDHDMGRNLIYTGGR